MPLTPETHDRLTELFRKFDSFPEVAHTDAGVLMKTGAFLAFLDARQLIETLRHEIHDEIKGWRDIARYFDEEPETACVLLWAVLPESGEPGVAVGYYDPDERSWYRQGEGPDRESVPLEPTKFMALHELMRAAR